MVGVSSDHGINAPLESGKSPAVRSTLGLLPLIALSAALTGPAAAQEGEISLDTVNVQGGTGSAANTNATPTGLARRPGTARSQPQTINTVSNTVLEQQQTRSLEDALRNVPGVTVRIGEGGGGLNGDQFNIRGFEGKGDIYSDGLRDAGVRTRDSFAYEDVQVIKGPSSDSFGMGTTGAAINTRIKKAHLENEGSVEATIGTGLLGRTVVDVNRRISETSALRIVGMGQYQDLVEKDNIFSHGAGVLATFGVGIGTDLQWDVSYLYQYGSRRPDYGVPMLANPANGAASPVNPSLPITEFGIPRNYTFVKAQDHDITNSHALTSNLRWQASEVFSLYNDTRLSYDSRDFSASVPGGVNAAAFFAGAPATSAPGGGSPTYLQDSFGIQNVLTGVGEFETGSVRHQVVGGIDLYYQSNFRDSFFVQGKTNWDVYNPGASFADPYAVLPFNPNPASVTTNRAASSFNAAAFVSDRIWFHETFSVLAGLRYDYYAVNSASYNKRTGAVTGTETSTSGFLSPKASLIWEPTRNQTYYASWAMGQTPPGQFVTNSSGDPVSAAAANAEPETSNSYEIGAKYDFLEGRLGLTAALYQVSKNQVIYTDPVTGALSQSGEGVTSRGIELGLSGQVTDAWTVAVAYAFNDARINASNATPANVGNFAPYASPHSGSIWTSYDIAHHIDAIPGAWLVGGGVTYKDAYFTNSANTGAIPATFSLDMFTSYETEKFKVALNAYNLTNNLNYSAGWGNRAVVAPGRTFTLTGTLKF
jgi:catecholate siderophore receptor